MPTSLFNSRGERRRMSVIATLALAVSAHVFAGRNAVAHFDVLPYSNGSSLVTGGHDDLADVTESLVSVFGYDFEYADPPVNTIPTYFAPDPGFNNGSAFTTGVFPDDGKLPAGSLVLNLFDGPYSSLNYWSGTGSPAFSPVTGGVEINLNRALSNLRVGAATTSGTITVGTVPGAGVVAGRIHQHLQSSIGVGGSGGTFDTLGAPDGIYAFGATLSVGGQASEPIYFVFNQGMSETVHDEAIDFYNVQVVPEPSSMILAAGGIAVAGGLLRRRRRQK
jgi:hypothetical protein